MQTPQENTAVPQTSAIARLVLLACVLRAVLGGWMWGVRHLVPPVGPGDPILRLYRGLPPETNPWLEPWQRWDTPQYQAIAERGYAAFDTALFTPPLYPLLMRATAAVTGGDTLAAGLLISELAAIAAAILLYRMARFELRDEGTAFRTVFYLLIFPTAFFLSAAYTESVFLLTAILSLYAARRERWIQAGLWGGLAALTRVPGALIVVPLAYAAWQAWKANREPSGAAAPLLAAGIAGLFPLYVWLGLHLPPAAIAEAVGRGGALSIPGANLLTAARRILSGQLVMENSLELGFTALFLVLTVYIWRSLPRLYGVYAAAFMALYLTRMGTPQPLVSMTRYVLVIFPAFMVLGRWGQSPWVHRLIVIASLLGLLFLSGQFAIWGWAG